MWRLCYLLNKRDARIPDNAVQAGRIKCVVLCSKTIGDYDESNRPFKANNANRFGLKVSRNNRHVFM